MKNWLKYQTEPNTTNLFHGHSLALVKLYRSSDVSAMQLLLHMLCIDLN